MSCYNFDRLQSAPIEDRSAASTDEIVKIAPNSWPFSKFAGCGNDFILFDNRLEIFPTESRQLVQQLCNRRLGIGADGLLLLEESDNADCTMRIFNANGSEAEMCGNGLRCFVKWLPTIGMQNVACTIEVSHQIYHASYEEDGMVRIAMHDPIDVMWNIPILFGNQQLIAHYLNTGVPHAVLFIEAIDSVQLSQLGPFLRHHPLWGPKGANVSIAEKMTSSQFKVRTYERGVEAETPACGTGAVAVAAAAAFQQHLTGPIRLHTKSGEDLLVDFVLNKEGFCSNITLRGPATFIYQGEIVLPPF